MNMQRWGLASLAVFVAVVIMDGVIHGVLLADLYQQTASVWRPKAEMDGLMWLMWVASFIYAPIFVLIYARGHEPNKEGLGQGIRFGLLMGLLFSATQSLGWYAVLPIPGILAGYWFAAGMVESLVEGAIVGLIYRPA